MSKIFKGSNIAVASAVALALAGGMASAAKLSVTANQLSTEAMANTTVANLVQSPAITVQLEQNYDNDQLLVLNFTNFTVDSINQAADVVCTQTAGGTVSVIDFALQGSTTSSVTLRATGRASSPANHFCVIPAASILGAPAQFVTATTATVTSKGTNTTGTIEFDLGTTATSVFVSASQFTAAATTALNGVIDVNQSRGSFADGVTTDVFAFSFTNAASKVGYTGAAATNASVIAYRATVTGDFSFIDDDQNGCTFTDLDAGAGSISYTGTSAGTALAGGVTVTGVSTACNSMVVTLTPGAGRPGADAVYGVTLTYSKGGTAAPQLVAGGFTAATAINYEQNTSATSSYATFGAGSWTYNGFVAVVPFMPIQDNFSNTIYVSNRSGQANGNISVTAYVEGAAPCTFTLTDVSVSANRTFNIGGKIKSQIRNCTGMSTGNLRATLVITSPLPAASTELFSAYTDTTNNRTVPVVNSSSVYRNR